MKKLGLVGTESLLWQQFDAWTADTKQRIPCNTHEEAQNPRLWYWEQAWKKKAGFNFFTFLFFNFLEKQEQLK